ncbi:terminase small subunit [Pseudomonas sp. R4-84]
MALTPKQEAFCLAYLKTGNASEAYRQAYTANDMKPATINRKAKDVLDNGKIAARLAELNQSAVTDSVMTRQRALERLSLIAETSITDILEFDQREIDGPEGPVSETIWRMKDSVEIPEVAAATIKSVTMTKFGPKIEMYDRLSAIQQLARMQGWESAQKHDHTSSDGSMSPKGKSLDDFYTGDVPA